VKKEFTASKGWNQKVFFDLVRDFWGVYCGLNEVDVSVVSLNIKMIYSL